MIGSYSKIDEGDKLYLIQEAKNKFWEISNYGIENKIRYGKWNMGRETKVLEGRRLYCDTSASLDRALALILDKDSKGYILFKKENHQKPKVNNRFSKIIGRNPDDIELEI